jgi:outer membrane usher protein
LRRASSEPSSRRPAGPVLPESAGQERTSRPKLAALALMVAALLHPGSTIAADQRAQLDLFVNGAPHGVVLVLLRGDDVLVAVDDLERSGLRGFDGRREPLERRTFVSLRSLEPLARFELDERALALRITAQAALLGSSAFDLRAAARPPGLVVRSDPSGFFNYSAQLQTGGRFSGFAEAGGGWDGKLLYGSGSLLVGGHAVRDLTSLTIDEPESLRRWIAGDTFAAATGLGGGVFLGGLSLVKEYSLDPYRVHGPMPHLSGYAPTPSTLDVYVNGILVRQQPLPPGGYDLANLPVTSGAGNVRTVLRDALGRTEVLDWSYYYSSGLLGRDFTDYGYHLGFERRGYGTESFDYGRPLLIARHRYGFTDELTLGGRMEVADDLVSAGPTATIGLPWGEAEASAAVSYQGGASGAAGSLAYSYSCPQFSGSALVRWMSTTYANASRRATEDRPRVQASASLGVPILPRLSMTASYSLLDYRDAGLSDSATLLASYGLARDLTLIVTGSRTRASGSSPSLGLFATLSWAIAPATVADVSMQTGTDGTGASTGIQHSLPAGTGFGYRARVVSGPGSEAATGLLQYQWDYGRYELQYDRFGSDGLATATATGGVAFVGGRAFLSRTIQDGFGLMRVGAPGVRGYLEGQEVGRTDSKGDLLVPNLLPYYGNRLSIADSDVPMDYRIGATQKLAAPTWRLGTVTRFDMEQIRTLTGIVVVEAAGQEVIPVFGEISIRLPAGEAASPIGRDGRFYFENLPVGRHAAQVEWDGGGRCRLVIDAPEAPHGDLGRVRCRTDVVLPPAPVAPPRKPGAVTPPTGSPVRPAEPIPAPIRSSAPAPAPKAAIPPIVMASMTTAFDRSTIASPAVATPSPFRPPSSGAATVSGRSSPRLQTRRCPSCAICLEAALEHERREARAAACTNLLAEACRVPQQDRSTLQPDLYELCGGCIGTRRSRSCQ